MSNNNDLWNHPLYALKTWWNGGRDVEILRISDTRHTAHVKDKVTGREFIMSASWTIGSRPGSLVDYTWECEDVFSNFHKTMRPLVDLSQSSSHTHS
jgi:hypothetical protein